MDDKNSVPDRNKKGDPNMAIAPDQLPMVRPADHIQGPGQGRWTYKDYAALPDDGKRYEIVDGVLFMAPSPGRWHQKAAGKLYKLLSSYIEDMGLGEVYIAPFDVEHARPFADGQDFDTVPRIQRGTSGGREVRDQPCCESIREVRSGFRPNASRIGWLGGHRNPTVISEMDHLETISEPLGGL